MSEPPGWSSPGEPEQPQESTSGGWGGHEVPAGWGSPPPGPGWAAPAPGPGGPPPPGQGAPSWQGYQAAQGQNQWQGQGPWQAPRPGVIPLRPLALGEILDGAFQVIRRQVKPVLLFSLVVAVVNVAVGTLLPLAFGAALDQTTFNSGPGFVTGTTAGGVGAQLFSIIVNGITSGLLVAAMSVFTSEAVLGRTIGARDVWRRLRPRLGALVLVGLLFSVLPYLGLILLIVPGIWLWGSLALSVPAAALERAGVGRSLSRSRQLVRRSWWRVWGIRVLATLIANIAAVIITLPALAFGVVGIASSLGSGNPNLGVGAFIGIALLAVVAQVLTAPFPAAVLALLYVDRRIRSEALDLTLARAAGQPATAPGPGYPTGYGG